MASNKSAHNLRHHLKKHESRLFKQGEGAITTSEKPDIKLQNRFSNLAESSSEVAQIDDDEKSRIEEEFGENSKMKNQKTAPAFQVVKSQTRLNKSDIVSSADQANSSVRERSKRNKKAKQVKSASNQPAPESASKNEKRFLRLGSLNICKGLYTKEKFLLDTIEKQEIDIFGVSETDLKHFDESRPFSLKGFKTYYPLKRQDIDMKRILCFVRQGVEVTERQDLMSPNLSTIWLEHKPVKGKNAFLFSI